MPTETNDATLEREREIAEEEAYEREVYGSGSVPDITVPLKRVSAAIVRDWTRAALVPAALKRLYDIGMGVTRFEVPTMAGNVVKIPAPASVQARALQAVIGVGVPQSVGLTGEGEQLPGVIAVGEWELEEHRIEAHSGVRSLPAAVSTGGIEVPPEPPAQEPYVAPEGHEVVEIVESATAGDVLSTEDAPPAHEPIAAPVRDLAKTILARRRASRGIVPGEDTVPGIQPGATDGVR